MTKAFTVLKIALVAVLITGLAFGYLFFRVWQKNERPEVLTASWSEKEILIGHAATLTVTIEAPWHREFELPSPLSYPEFLAPVTNEATLDKGQLSPLGTRTWTLAIPFVATDTKSLEGLTTSFPVKNTKRISPNFVDVPLPELAIVTPEKVPEDPVAPDTFLTENEPPVSEDDEVTSPEEPFPLWAWITIAVVVLFVGILLLRKTGIIKTTPPWERALGNLAKLNPGEQPVPFYSKLTDILKQYTSERFEVRARSKTSTEFLAILQNHPNIPKGELDRLDSFARLSDAVKFADHDPDSTEAPRSLELIRSFVKDTTPDPDEEKKRDRIT
jgi:hypothetical protein